MLKTIEEQLAELKAMSEHDIDTSDIPESGHLNWETAETGKFFRPNKSVAIVDNDVIEWFANKHENINDVLRQYMLQHR